MERKEYLQWCKDRALQYIEDNDIQNAFASMMSDLQKHDDTQGHLGINLGMSMMINGQLGTAPKMREFIESFN